MSVGAAVGVRTITSSSPSSVVPVAAAMLASTQVAPDPIGMFQMLVDAKGCTRGLRSGDPASPPSPSSLPPLSALAASTGAEPSPEASVPAVASAPTAPVSLWLPASDAAEPPLEQATTKAQHASQLSRVMLRA